MEWVHLAKCNMASSQQKGIGSFFAAFRTKAPSFHRICLATTEKRHLKLELFTQIGYKMKPAEALSPELAFEWSLEPYVREKFFHLIWL